MTGIRVRALWDTETTYGTMPSTNINEWHIFGPNMEMSIERNNDTKFLDNLGVPYHVDAVPGPYGIRASVSFALNPDHIEWLETLQGRWETSSSAGVYTHTFTRDWDAVHGNWRRNKSFTIRYSKLNQVIDSTVDDETVDIRGCVINSATIGYEISNATINVRLEIVASRDYPNVSAIIPYTAPTGRAAVFATLQKWSGSEWNNIALTDRADITIGNNITLLGEGGTRFKVDYVMGKIRAEVNTRCRSKSPATYIHALYGASTGPQEKLVPVLGDLRLYVTNGLTGTDERSVAIKMTDCTVTGVSQGFNVSQPIYDSPRITAKYVTIEVVNASSHDITAPTANAGIDQSASAGDTVTFDGSASATDDPFGLTYTWAFFDDGLVQLYGEAPEYTFDTAGTYTVYLTVKDSYGQSDTDSMTVTVSA